MSCGAQSPPDEIEQVRENSLNYLKQLPNFVCETEVRRYYDPGVPSGWMPIDTVRAQLSYVEGREQYTQVRVNEKPATSGIEGLRGAMAEGEFGTLMRDVFLPQSEARFIPEHRKKLRGREMSVFKFDIKKEHSRYRINADSKLEYVAAVNGEIFVDDEMKMVMRIVVNPYNIPSGFPVQSVKTTLDYGFITLSGKRYLLPVRAEVISEHHHINAKNVAEFRRYRKFGAETNLKFDTPDVPLH